jgi:hypothetical protein
MKYEEQQTAFYLLVKGCAGRSQRELGEALYGPGARQQKANQPIKALVSRGLIQERKRADGRYGYWP